MRTGFDFQCSSASTILLTSSLNGLFKHIPIPTCSDSIRFQQDDSPRIPFLSSSDHFPNIPTLILESISGLHFENWTIAYPFPCLRTPLAALRVNVTIVFAITPAFSGTGTPSPGWRRSIKMLLYHMLIPEPRPFSLYVVTYSHEFKDSICCFQVWACTIPEIWYCSPPNIAGVAHCHIFGEDLCPNFLEALDIEVH